MGFDGRCKPLSLQSKEKARGLRLTSNPNISVSLIVRIGLEISLPLHMTVDKGGKIPELNISKVRGKVRMVVQRTSHFM